MPKQSRIKAYARFLGASFSANFLAVIEYRANFSLRVFGMMLNNGAFALFWGVLLGRTGGIGGYEFTDVMFVWAVVSAAFGLAHVVFGNIRNLGRTIVSAWDDLAYGLIVAALLPGFGLGHLLLFCALKATGAVIFASTLAAAESLAFFLGNSQAISSAPSEFPLSFSLYPETIFDKGMRWLFYTILPSGFIASVPFAIYRSLDWRLIPVLIFVAVPYAGLSYALFRVGLRRYESGNQMGARVQVAARSVARSIKRRGFATAQRRPIWLPHASGFTTRKQSSPSKSLALRVWSTSTPFSFSVTASIRSKLRRTGNESRAQRDASLGIMPGSQAQCCQPVAFRYHAMVSAASPARNGLERTAGLRSNRYNSNHTWSAMIHSSPCCKALLTRSAQMRCSGQSALMAYSSMLVSRL